MSDCKIWGDDTDCSSAVANGVCDSGNPPNEPAACVDGCADAGALCDTPGATQCVADTLQTCTSTGGSPSCDVWVDTDCTTAEPLGACQDNGPSECVACANEACSPGETQCQGDTLLTCVADATTGCGDWDGGSDCTDTPGGQGSCTEGSPDACADPCSALSDLCSTGDTYRCDPTNEDYVQSCSTGQNGCLQWQFNVDCVAIENDIFGQCNLLEDDNCSLPDGCFAEQPILNFDPPNLPLVLDHSGSMYDFSFGIFDTRWEALVDTVDSAVLAYQDQINFGIKWFPSNETTCQSPEGCEVDPGFDVAPAPSNYDAIMTPLNALGNPSGVCYTPSQDAWTETYLALQTDHPGESNSIMLVIDGGISTNCTGNAHADLVSAIEAVADQTPTYVVGIGTTGNSAENASQYAIVGNGQRDPEPGCFTQEFVNLDAGDNVITFRYDKNATGLDHADFVWIDDVRVTANNIVFEDDFESGSFGSEWSSGGDAAWRFNRVTSYEGSMSVRSGYIQDDQTSDLILTLNMPQAGTLTFRRRVENESDTRFVLLVGSEEYVRRAQLPPAPTRTALHQNYPNPFNPSTVIRYDLAVRGRVTVKIYDVAGRLVRTLDERDRSPGIYELGWSGENDRGETVSSGVYFYRLTAPQFTQTKKMVLLK